MALAGHSGTHTAVDAFVRMNDEHVRALIEAIDRAHLHAICVLALDTILGDDVGHEPLTIEKPGLNLELHDFL